MSNLRITLLTVAACILMSAATVSAKGRKQTKSRKATTTQTTRKASKATAKSNEPEDWVLFNVAAGCLRNAPSHSASLETQASYGTPAKVLSRQSDWYRVELPDGYKAWVIGTSLVDRTPAEMEQWRNAQRLIVTQPRPFAAYSDSTNTSDGNIAMDVVIGSIFEGIKAPGSAFSEVVLPDGRKAYLQSANVEDFSTWSKREPQLDTIMNTARSMMGITYLWGGTTPKAIDCSGYTKVAFGAAGLILPRNASDQALVGETLDPAKPDEFRRGDLLFFGTGAGTTVTHVGIYDGFTRFLHSSGRVFESSFKPGHPLYLPRKVIGACRILSVPSSKGVTTCASHPWYFQQ